MNVDTCPKWAVFDEIANQIKAVQGEYLTWHTERMRYYGNTMFSPGMISGHTWPNWSPEDRKMNRDWLDKINKAKDEILTLKPARTHKRTAINRLQVILRN
jgi:hypothetical protein